MHAPAQDIHAAALDDRSALREMIRIATPAVVGMLSFSMMQFVDRLLCARLIGPEALAAAGNGGIASWVPASVMMGLLGVINTYVSQNLGAGRPERGPAYAWAGIWLGAIVWLCVLLPYAAFFPAAFASMRDVLGLDPVSEHIHRMESDYGRLLLYGMLLTLTARTIGHYFYGMHKPWVVMSATIAGNIVNLIASYALIMLAKTTGPEGSEAVAELGVRGSAVGTIIGTAVECAIPMAIFLSSKYQRLYSTRSSWRFSFDRVREIFRIGWPGGVMFGNEMVCWWIFMGGFVASFDKGNPLAVHGPAGWITHQYLMLSFMPAVGISIAVTAIVGKCIGAGRHDLVARRTWMGVRLTLAYMGACALCFVLFGKQLANLFLPDSATPEQAQQIIELARVMLILAATFQLFDGLAITISGALRGAGDTVWPGVVTIILSWTLIVGGGWIAKTFVPQASSYGPWAAASLYICTLSLCFLFRFQSGHWKRIKVIDRAADSPPTPESTEGAHPALAADIGPAGVAMAPGLDIPQDDRTP
jgi:MATE family multidrug resistance protein